MTNLSDDTHISLIPSDSLPNINCSEQKSSCTLRNNVSDTRLPNYSILPSRKIEQSRNGYPPPASTISRRRCTRQLTISAISRQLRIRDFLQNRLGFISNIKCFLGIFGIILMIIANEINFSNRNPKYINIVWFIQLILTFSTIILICLIIYYHHLNLKLYATYNSLDHYHFSLTMKKIFFIIFEILICAIHPIPRNFRHNIIINEQKQMNSTLVYNSTSSYDKSLDVILGLPMFVRLYLIGRCILFRSHLVRDVPSKSFGSFSQVSINLTFLMKTYLQKWPARCLITLCFLIFLIGSWSIRACDCKSTNTQQISIFDSMWLFIITFTTVGYGDITPSTYCGRLVTSIIALFGLLSSALFISVVAQKLQLSHWEKYVHKFVSDIELNHQRREQSANIIKFAMHIWYLKRKSNHRSYKYIRSQCLLFKSIHYLHKLKHEQRKLNDKCLDLIELINTQNSIGIQIKTIEKDIALIKLTNNSIEDKFNRLNHTITDIHQTLNFIINKTIK